MTDDMNTYTHADATQETQEVVDQSSQELVEQLEQPLEAQASEGKAKKTAEYNFRELREKTERLERERNELARRMAEIEQRTMQPQQQPEPEFDVRDDDLVEGKTLKKIAQRIENKYEKKFEEYQRQQREVTTEMLLKSRFNDFEQVVNDATITKLRDSYPEVAQTLYAYQDPYTKLSAAYKLIKDLNLMDADMHNYEEDKKIAQANLKKPRAAGTMSPQSGTTPLQQANQFAKRYHDGMDAQIRAEMEEILKR